MHGDKYNAVNEVKQTTLFVFERAKCLCARLLQLECKQAENLYVNGTVCFVNACCLYEKENVLLRMRAHAHVRLCMCVRVSPCIYFLLN